MTKLEVLTKKASEWESNYGDAADAEKHPTWGLDDHPEGFDMACFCSECGTWD